MLLWSQALLWRGAKRQPHDSVIKHMDFADGIRLRRSDRAADGCSHWAMSVATIGGSRDRVPHGRRSIENLVPARRPAAG
jgi:hypothetical protein